MVILAFQSALDFWRRAPQRAIDTALASLRRQSEASPASREGGSTPTNGLPAPDDTDGSARRPSLSECASVCALFPTVFGGPLHVMVPSCDARLRARGVASHVSACRYPPASFAEIAPGAWVASPALCFVQLATSLPLPLSIELGMEICGRYRKDSRHEKGMVARPPLASPEELLCYCERACGISGRKRACQAARLVAPGSRSPMESVLFELIALPRRLGGRNLPPPLLNERIEIAKPFRHLSRKGYFEADFLWPDLRLVLEYDSNQEHTGSERIADDAARKNALTAMGYTVVTLTTRQLMSYQEFLRFLDALRRGLHASVARNEDIAAEAQFDLWRKLTNPACFKGLPGEADPGNGQ